MYNQRLPVSPGAFKAYKIANAPVVAYFNYVCECIQGNEIPPWTSNFKYICTTKTNWATLYLIICQSIDFFFGTKDVKERKVNENPHSRT
jgi:hypothetical protein